MDMQNQEQIRQPDERETRGNELCCCPPRARVWIETRTEAIYVENKTEMQRRLQVRADANTTIRPPAGPDANADGSGGSQIDEGTLKEQGKIYRVDTYVVHWSAEGAGDLEVALSVLALGWRGTWLGRSDSVSLAKAYLLTPPDYQPPSPDSVEATITVRDCFGHVVTHSQSAMRP